MNYLIQNIETASAMSSLNFSEVRLDMYKSLLYNWVLQEVMNILNNVLDDRNAEGWQQLQEVEYNR